MTDPAGKPIAGAALRLVAKGWSTVSGSDGAYAFTGPGALVPPRKGEVSFGGARLRLRSTGAGMPEGVEWVDLSGRKIALMGGRPATAGYGISRVTAPAKAAAAEGDTLEARAGGYILRKIALAVPEGHQDVVLAAQLRDPGLAYPAYAPKPGDRVIPRSDYARRLHGMWLGESLANWTGLVTEMDKIQPPFYTRADWGKRDQRSIWGVWGPNPDTLIDYTFTFKGKPWGADDDTDLEYMYQDLMDVDDASVLTAAQIRDGWLRHIRSQEENYLWVSNQRAFDLMRAGKLPPETSLPANNPDYDMIDAQLTTEIFGAFAPVRPDVADRLASLPIRTTAYGGAELIAHFYVRMYSLAAAAPEGLDMKAKTRWLAAQARLSLPDTSYPAKMYDYVWGRVQAGVPAWETVRDELHARYQVNHADGYDVTARPGIVCMGCYAAGINFASSLVSLFYGEGDLPKTVQIASLCGWDSDNPTATWGGLLGLLLGKDGIETAFGRTDFSDTFWIHRTRQNFPDRTPGVDGEDTFPMMAERGVYVTDRVVIEEMHGGADPERDVWYIPAL